MTTELFISIGAFLVALLTFIANRKDKAVSDTKESNYGLIKFRLDQLDKNVEKILDKLDNYDKEMDEKIEKAMSNHIDSYHKRKKAN